MNLVVLNSFLINNILMKPIKQVTKALLSLQSFLKETADSLIFILHLNHKKTLLLHNPQFLNKV